MFRPLLAIFGFLRFLRGVYKCCKKLRVGLLIERSLYQSPGSSVPSARAICKHGEKIINREKSPRRCGEGGILKSKTICMLHYNPRHVSSINMPIFRRTNCIITASGIVTLCKRLCSTESDDNRCCDNTICPPEDGHVNARNMSKIVM